MTRSYQDSRRLRRGGRRLARIALTALLAVLCIWWQFLRLPHEVEITDMEPELSGSMTHLDCSLTLDFKGAAPPDPRDLEVVFEGDAIEGGRQRFDWRYIALHDVRASGPPTLNTDTSPESEPQVGDSIRVSFPIHTRDLTEDTSDPISLVAVVYWGGTRQDSAHGSVAHPHRVEDAPL